MSDSGERSRTLLWRCDHADEQTTKCAGGRHVPMARPRLRRSDSAVEQLRHPSLRGDRIGTALKGSRLGASWKYQAGDCRIITRIEDNAFRVPIVRVARRDRVSR